MSYLNKTLHKQVLLCVGISLSPVKGASFGTGEAEADCELGLYTTRDYPEMLALCSQWGHQHSCSHNTFRRRE